MYPFISNCVGKPICSNAILFLTYFRNYSLLILFLDVRHGWQNKTFSHQLPSFWRSVRCRCPSIEFDARIR